MTLPKTSSSNQTHWYRLITDHLVPIQAQTVLAGIGNTLSPVHKITAGGLIFRNHSLQVGEWCCADIVFPSLNRTITALIEVTHMDENHTCTCRFKGLHSDNKTVIETYLESLTTRSDEDPWGKRLDRWNEILL